MGAFPPMNASVYFGEIFNQHHIDLYDLLTTCFSPLVLLINCYGLYVVKYHSAAHLQVLRPHLMFHQVVLIVVDFMIFHGKPVMLFPVAAGFSLSILGTMAEHASLIHICLCKAFWALSASTSIQIILFKHQNLWPPGSRWTLGKKSRIFFCVYVNCLAAFSASVPLYISGLDHEGNKELLKAMGIDFLSDMLDRPDVGTVAQEGPAFITFAAFTVHMILFMLTALVFGTWSTHQGLKTLRPQISSKTYNMQKKYLVILLTQLTAPLIFALIPGVLAVWVIVSRTWVPVAFNLILFSMVGTHALVSTLFNIFLNQCYRKPFIRLLLFPIRMGKQIPSMITKKMKSLIFAVFCISFTVAEHFAIKLIGKVRCAGEVYENAYVQEFKKEGNKLASLEGDSLSDANGKVVFATSTTSNKKPEIVLKIAHSCAFSGGRCSKKNKVVIPATYVCKGRIASKTIDFETINLERGGEVECG